MVRLILFLVVAAQLRAQDLSVEQIIAKAIEAIGGQANLAKVDSIELKARIRFGQGEFGPLRVVAKRPSLFRMEMTIGPDHVTQAYDGAIGWQAVTGEHKQDPVVLTGESLAHLIDQAANAIGGPLIDLEKRHNEVSLAGREPVNGVDCYKLKVTLGTGDTMDVFLDPTTFQTVQEELPMRLEGRSSTIQESVGNYRKFGSILMACLFVTHEKGGEDGQRMEIDAVEINPKVDASVFKMPAAK